MEESAMSSDGALIVMREDEATREWPLPKDGEIFAGRDGSCEIHLPDRQISRRHAIFQRRPEGVFVNDLGSKNGTWVNGVQVQSPVLLRDGDEVSIAARYKVYFVDAEATAPVVFDRRGLRIDGETLMVFVSGQAIDPPLSGPQYELLKLLYDAGGSLVGRDDIVEHVWPDAARGGVSEDALDALVRRLRLRLAEYDDEHQYILTVRGYGFRIDMP
jgi:DNA-binding response OmpR family regulator